MWEQHTTLGHNVERIDQTSDVYIPSSLVPAHFSKIVAPGSTLPASPAFFQSEEEAMISHPDWVDECRNYRAGMHEKSVSGLALILSTAISTQLGYRQAMLPC